MRGIVSIAGLFAASGLCLVGCNRESTAYTKVEPAHVEHIKGQEISKVTLTEKAVERLDVQTVPIQQADVGQAENKQVRPVVPYSALMYLSDGTTFVYTSPAPRSYMRAPVKVDYIEGDKVILMDGPQPGTEVVSVGAAELFGTEFGVGH